MTAPRKTGDGLRQVARLVYMTPQQFETITQAAKSDGRTFSTFCLMAALKIAEFQRLQTPRS